MLAFELQEVKTKYRSGVTQTQGYLSHVFKFGQWKQCIQISSRLNSLECVDDCVCIEFSFPGAIPSIACLFCLRFPEDNAQQNLVYFSSSVQYANGCENVFRLNMQSQCSIPNGKKKKNEKLVVVVRLTETTQRTEKKYTGIFIACVQPLSYLVTFSLPPSSWFV